MEWSFFFRQWLLVSVLAITGLVFFSNYLPNVEHMALGWIGFAFFVILSLMIYRWGKKSAQSKDANAFTRLIMYNLMIKLFASVLIVIIYYWIKQPYDKLFILPFVFIYFLFTLFETYFLTKLARQQ
ncbi:MAG TPA: hypothetical protein PKC30_06830 [Saprospiraceae bacterium]|mgnify:CR=1 FL=1|nr:hypothetical protein [Saprospiraceae bacterium]